MSSIGLNVRRDGSDRAETIAGLNATWARIVLTRHIDLTATLMAYRAHGIQALGVVANESLEDFSSPADALAHYARAYTGLLAALQVGNEPDHVSDSSFTMSQADLVALGKLARAAFPSTPIVCAGLASGHPEWLDGVDLSWCSAIAVHPYAKDAENPTDVEDQPDVQPLIREYARFGKPILITEWGWPSDELPRAAAEIHDMVSWAAKTVEIGAFFYFALGDDVPPFGLLDAAGNEKEAKCRAFRGAARHPASVSVQVPAPPPVQAPAAAVPTEDAALHEAWRALWQAVVPSLPYDETIATWSIPTYWREHFAELGSPIRFEIDAGGGVTYQPFATGILKYNPERGVERIA